MYEKTPTFGNFAMNSQYVGARSVRARYPHQAAMVNTKPVAAATRTANTSATTVSLADFFRAASCCAKKFILELHLRRLALRGGVGRLK